LGIGFQQDHLERAASARGVEHCLSARTRPVEHNDFLIAASGIHLLDPPAAAYLAVLEHLSPQIVFGRAVHGRRYVSSSAADNE
jgi:hypothetical protein